MRRGIRSIILESPTGSGKTLLTAHMIKGAQAKGLNAWFLMHRIELLDPQAIRAFSEAGVDFGIVAPGYSMDNSKNVQLCSIGTLRRRMDLLRIPDLVVYDEAHHIASKTWAEIHVAYPKAFHIGLTATPERLDGKGLGTYFQEMVRGPGVRWLIDNGFLSDYRLVLPPGGVNADGIHRQMGDFNRHELAEAASGPTITGNAIREYLKYARGKRAIARHVNIELSQRLAADFRASGVPAIHVDGKTPRLERRAAMDDFVAGKILVLCNVDLFSEGVNVPAVEAILDLNPTESLTLCLQFWGRGLRPAPGKTKAIIIDMAGNFHRHGLPCEVREWSLAGRKKGKKAGSSIVTTQCPVCYAVLMGRPPVCREMVDGKVCGHVFETGGGRSVEHVEGELIEADVEAIRIAKIQRQREIAACVTLQDFQNLAKKLNYKPGWAWFRWKIKVGKTAAA